MGGHPTPAAWFGPSSHMYSVLVLRTDGMVSRSLFKGFGAVSDLEDSRFYITTGDFLLLVTLNLYPTLCMLVYL